VLVPSAMGICEPLHTLLVVQKNEWGTRRVSCDGGHSGVGRAHATGAVDTGIRETGFPVAAEAGRSKRPAGHARTTSKELPALALRRGAVLPLRGRACHAHAVMVAEGFRSPQVYDAVAPAEKATARQDQAGSPTSSEGGRSGGPQKRRIVSAICCGSYLCLSLRSKPAP
jgi:hypothetical protein